MKKYCLITLFSLLSCFAFAQVGIGTTNPSTKSMLEVSSTSDGGTTYKGLMPPRVPTIADRNAINPGFSDFGLLVFVEESGCLNMWDGDSWENVSCVTVATPEIWINEIHYDNVGTDTGEAIEIAGAAGVDLSDYQIVLYNGLNGNMYGSTITLSGILINDINGFGFQSFSYVGIQNDMEGIALVKVSTGNVIQFLSYEGSFTANNGPAVGMASIDIGVSESNITTAIGTSMQLVGTGSEYVDFTWSTEVPETYDGVNNGQTMN